jgi:hypothetical protein
LSGVLAIRPETGPERDRTSAQTVDSSGGVTTIDYYLVRKEFGGMLFVSGDNPKAVKTDRAIEHAKRFDSPGDALAFRSGMDAHCQSQFIVHEYDGSLLHSLDV